MNKTKIEWCDYTWSPITGCLHGCPYCYARRIDKRFGDGKFTPTFHPDRLEQPLKVKKPSRIFVGSVSDLFGAWTWRINNGIVGEAYARWFVVDQILETVNQCPQHTFIFLTKNPKGMQGFDFPTNCWCGTSVENQEKADERRPELLKVGCKTLFVSYEPALGPLDLTKWTKETCTNCGGIGRVPNHPHIIAHTCPMCKGTGKVFYPRFNWLIIGAQTGPGAEKPDHRWISGAIQQAKNADIPTFVKDNCNWFDKIQEWPGVKE